MLLNRRTVITSALATAAAGLLRTPTFAAETPATVLRLQRREIDMNGKSASVYRIAQPNGVSGLTTGIGERFRVRVENQIDKPSLIHWHGLTPPWQQDGVPGISSPAIPPGGSADYDFSLNFGGTFWMHSHQGFQEQLLMTAPLIIHDQRDTKDQQEVVLMLHDFSFKSPEEIYASLRKPGNMSGMAMRGMDMSGMDMKDMSTPGMQMGKTGAHAVPDLNDVTYDAFLANDRTLADPEVIKVEPGGRVLLRVINGSSMSNFHLDLGALSGKLIAVDGLRIQPVSGQRFPIAVAQRLDIELTIPAGAAAHPVLAILEGAAKQTGIVLSAGAATVSRIPDQAAQPSPALTLDLERNLKALDPLAPRKPDRVHTINLTGDMATYVWSINGVPWTKDVPPLAIAQGERVELIIINKNPMPHPMHLHGHPFQVVEIDGQRFSGAKRDTVLVPENGRVVVAFDANNPGWWAFHCHLLYHMAAGMFTTLRYV
ncbi:multicopper oxidase family protein [Hyphomicrobium sp. MC1]|uniref:multicopper oxidase family protein n=1 Tax=Hyphomicrobium sp. (strain MC1) TaxID=717785 RepID=UPI000213D319|nr:multicopper oxidase family protein [Hyphomicrobium sp. MC1]CCB64311.1 Potential multicopper oxidase [Hyphomicrobium sp. MC1]